MRVINGIRSMDKPLRKVVLAIGIFDGVHLGHQALIQSAVNLARKTKGTPVVLTFHPHPVHVLRPQQYLPLLVSLQYRLFLLEQLGVKVCVVAKFTAAFSRLSASAFIRKNVVAKFSPQAIVVGDDFRFGKDRAGTLACFESAGKEFGFEVKTLPTAERGRKLIGSTMIRQLVAEGEIQKAARLLGRPVSLLGRVVRGDTRGRKLGFPTANINPPNAVLLPSGVFVARVRLGSKQLYGIANVGNRPSFKSTGRVNVEVHLFDYQGDLYGRSIVVELLTRIRNEERFWTQQELVTQITKDERFARRWLNRNSA